MNKKDLEEGKKRENVKIDVKDLKNKIKEQNLSIIKQESGVYHDGKRLLYEPDETFRSCCFEVDKDCVYYCGKMVISMSVLGFSFLMLQNPANDVAFYTSTISLLLGHFLNTPTSKDKGGKKEN